MPALQPPLDLGRSSYRRRQKKAPDRRTVMPAMRHLLGIGAALALSAFALTDPSLAQSAQAPSVQAQSGQVWPQRPVRFVLPLGPGAGVDITARLVADRLSARWGGQSVVVENKPGGDGVVALTSFIGAKDDHTL